MEALRSGSRIGGLRLGALMGRGGIADVFRVAGDATHVVKVLRPTENEEVRQRFRGEAALQRKVRSPRVAAVHDAGEWGGHLYFVMETRRGELLSALLDNAAAVTPEPCGHELLMALDEVHGAGVVHRDVKADNFLFDGASGTLLDFGMATKAAIGGLARVQLGSPSSWGPERLKGCDGADPRSDLFSAAIVLYQLVSAAHPFGFGSGDAAWKESLRRGIVPPLRAFKRETLSFLDPFFATALAPELDGRFADAKSMNAAWRQAFASKPGA